MCDNISAEETPDDIRRHICPELLTSLIISITFQGSVEFIESNDFHIEVNVTAESTDALARVHYNYTDYQGSVLLQMVSSIIMLRQ